MTPSERTPFEQWGLARCPEQELARLEPRVEALSRLFTDERPEAFNIYLDDPDTLTAYALFFAPQTYARVTAALEGVLARLPDFPERPLRILDLGCGFGSAAAAAKDIITERTGIEPELTCVDHSPRALQALQEFLPKAKTIHADLTTYTPTGTFDIILSSFAFNEIFKTPELATAAVERFSEALTPDAPSFILLLEPADRRATPRLLTLRDRLPHLPLYAPCPHRKCCPMIPTQDGICHDVRRFKPSRTMTLLNRKLYRTISDVKYTPLAFGRKDGPQADGFGDAEFLRLTGPMDKAKGLLTCRVCMGDGALRKLELPAASLTTDRRHELLDRQRGDTAWLDGPLEVRKRLQRDTIQRTADLRFSDEPDPELDGELDDFSFSI